MYVLLLSGLNKGTAPIQVWGACPLQPVPDLCHQKVTTFTIGTEKIEWWYIVIRHFFLCIYWTIHKIYCVGYLQSKIVNATMYVVRVSFCPSVKATVHVSIWQLINLYDPEIKALWKHFAKRRKNTGKQHCLLFALSFLPYQRKITLFDTHCNHRLQMLSVLTRLKFCCLVKC